MKACASAWSARQRMQVQRLCLASLTRPPWGSAGASPPRICASSFACPWSLELNAAFGPIGGVALNSYIHTCSRGKKNSAQNCCAWPGCSCSQWRGVAPCRKACRSCGAPQRLHDAALLRARQGAALTSLRMHALRIHICNKGAASQGARCVHSSHQLGVHAPMHIASTQRFICTPCSFRRDFLLANYAEIKKANPGFPVLVREATGAEAKLIARYGERVVTRSLQGNGHVHWLSLCKSRAGFMQMRHPLYQPSLQGAAACTSAPSTAGCLQLTQAVLLVLSCLPPMHPCSPAVRVRCCRLWCGAGGIHPGRECRRCGSKTRAACKKRTQVSAAVARKAAGQALFQGCSHRPGVRCGEERRSRDTRQIGNERMDVVRCGCALGKSDDTCMATRGLDEGCRGQASVTCMPPLLAVQGIMAACRTQRSDHRPASNMGAGVDHPRLGMLTRHGVILTASGVVAKISHHSDWGLHEHTYLCTGPTL